MSHIIGLFGTHGTGKSTILNGVKNAGLNVCESSLSRTAQKFLGWTELSEAEKSEDHMWALQDAIMAAMYDRDLEIIKSKQYTLVERTPADIWAYTEMWCTRLNIDFTTDARALGYKKQCRALAANYKLFIQVPISDAVSFVAEPNRADLKSRVSAEKAMQEFVMSGNLDLYRIISTGKEQRIGEAVSVIKLVTLENVNDCT